MLLFINILCVCCRSSGSSIRKHRWYCFTTWK